MDINGHLGAALNSTGGLNLRWLWRGMGTLTPFPRRRRPPTVAEAYRRDAAALRGDFKRALGQADQRQRNT